MQLVSIFLFLCFLFLLRKWKKYSNNTQTKKLPPGPWELPFIGSMHHLAGGLPHRVLRDLAKKYGPLMHLQLGEVSAVVVTFAEMAKQVLKTHDLAFASRPKFMAMGIIICYGRCNIAFTPYGEYWRQMHKICVMEVLSAKNVRSGMMNLFVSLTIKSSSSSGELVNFTERIIWFTCSMTCRSAFGQVLKEQEVFIKLIREVISLAEGLGVADIFPSYKFLHVFSGAKTKILNPHRKVDSIVEDVINEHKKNLAIRKNGDSLGGEDLIDVLLRLMNDRSLQFPINNGNIKVVIVVTNVYLPLAQLLYHFDWKLPTGMEARDLDLTELSGITAARKGDLYLIATPYQP
ncbi:hypothetical protein H5410_022627 [Solanum commersonii]|uniref:Premnaspirodiene oxygenase-like n=1 Tax=Solanum commersonii TaxID=4109 RepID=A0A9J5ZFC1_SOLCO|nr:hypothetical protein H5410_022627 [Solanum commersonii]